MDETSFFEDEFYKSIQNRKLYIQLWELVAIGKKNKIEPSTSNATITKTESIIKSKPLSTLGGISYQKLSSSSLSVQPTLSIFSPQSSSPSMLSPPLLL